MTAKSPNPPDSSNPPVPPGASKSPPYPAHWENVADLRVFRTLAEEWEKLIVWRTDMRKRGWKLLKISSDGPEVVAIFGRTKPKDA